MKVIKKLKQRAGEYFKSSAQDFAKGIRIGIGFLFAIGTAGIFAVAVTGTFNTFSSGGVMKAADINANFASLKAAIEGIPTQQSMRLIYETDLTSTQDSIPVSGLDGNTDKEYKIVTRITAANTSCFFGVRFNGISSSVYGWKTIGATSGPTPDAQANTTITSLLIGTANALGTTTYSDGFMLAKTGNSRIFHNLVVQSLSPATNSIYESYYFSSIWNDSTTNITSMTFMSNISNCYAAGSHIEVWARR